jgi:LysR family transcriptional regulator (chromosome initiation inhibitor)
MQIEYPQLGALVAVIREGSFEGAARALNVTPSAVSQRVKLLEEQVGGVLIVRGTPCRPTAVGEALYRHGLQVELLEKDLLSSVLPRRADHDESIAIGIAVNADSLATWLVPALAPFLHQSGHRVDIVVDDQDHTASWLRSGRVLGAITTEARAVQGCRVEPLGVMRYRATATPRFIRRWFPKGFTASALKRAPVLTFNRKDLLQERFVREMFGPKVLALRAQCIPSPTAFVEASLHDLGWGLNPEPLVEAHLARNSLRDLVPERWLDVPLFWQRWTLASHTLDALTAALRARAKVSLYPLRCDDPSSASGPSQ